MPAATSPPAWQVATQSVRGASHEQTGAPNQDASCAIRLEGGCGVVLAVADGHGDPLHARSDRGSRYAVAVASEMISAFILAQAGQTDEQVRHAASELPSRIVTAWRAKVRGDVEADPPPPGRGLDSAGGPELLYGSTLIAAGVCDRFGIFLQIGDGDILAVSDDNKVTRRARGRTDLPTHLTESLCQSDAVSRFRTELVLHDRQSASPLVLLSTDGYANSFVDEGSFLKVGRDLKSILDRKGIDHVSSKLEAWLSETSQAGSGDDISLSLMWRPSGEVPTAPRPRRRRRAVPVLAAAVVLVLLAPFVARAYFPSTWTSFVNLPWPKAIAVILPRPSDIPRPRPEDAKHPAAPADPRPETSDLPPAP